MLSEEPIPVGLERALGAQPAKRLVLLSRHLDRWDAQTRDVHTHEFMPIPVSRARLKLLTADSDWVFANLSRGKALALDDPSSYGMGHPIEALVFPSVHSLLVGWWLTHCWRSVELLQDGIRALQDWRIFSAAVLARSILEEAGCLYYEALRFSTSWAEHKASTNDPPQRAWEVNGGLGAELVKAGMGSRLQVAPAALQAVNVLTYVKKLGKDTGAPYTHWYDWLSDAAHPAFGARIIAATQPLLHQSGAVSQRWLSRGVLSVLGPDGPEERSDNEISMLAAEATAAAGEAIMELLEQSLAMVDDFGLTTGAADYTKRTYWRNYHPVRGTRACPCGAGPASRCTHRWGRPAPAVQLLRDDQGGAMSE